MGDYAGLYRHRQKRLSWLGQAGALICIISLIAGSEATSAATTVLKYGPKPKICPSGTSECVHTNVSFDNSNIGAQLPFGRIISAIYQIPGGEPQENGSGGQYECENRKDYCSGRSNGFRGPLNSYEESRGPCGSRRPHPFPTNAAIVGLIIGLLGTFVLTCAATIYARYSRKFSINKQTKGP